jgi:hypothetical protein
MHTRKIRKKLGLSLKKKIGDVIIRWNAVNISKVLNNMHFLKTKFKDFSQKWILTVLSNLFRTLRTHWILPGDQKGLFKLAIQLRPFCCPAVCNTATGYVFWQIHILREINSDKIVGYVCIKINGTKKRLELSMSVWSHQQPKVTPVIPFESKNQYCQLKQSFLITLYNIVRSFKFILKVGVGESIENAH